MDHRVALVHYQKQIDNFKKTIKASFKTLLSTFIVFLTCLVLGAFLFFYIEECAHVTQAPLTTPSDFGFHELCQLLRANTSTDNFENTSFHNELLGVCDNRKGEMPVSHCEMHIHSFIRWFGYVITIAFTIAFTIGYGDVVCHSDVGKAVTILYTLPAIAITVKLYVCAADILVTLTRMVVTHVEIKWIKRNYVHNLQWKILAIQIFMSLLFWSLIVISNIPLLRDDGWNILDAAYFSFITLTTIGFGDMTYDFEGALAKPYVFILTLIFYAFGIGALASVINELSQLGKKDQVVCSKCNRHETLFKNTIKRKPNKLTLTSHERKPPVGLEQTPEADITKVNSPYFTNKDKISTDRSGVNELNLKQFENWTFEELGTPNPAMIFY